VYQTSYRFLIPKCLALFHLFISRYSRVILKEDNHGN
jgi:hypothetical protein